MGNLSRRCHIGGGSRRAHASGRALGPLREVLGDVVGEVIHDKSTGLDIEILKELLACGHVVNRKQDFMGPTNACRRRCWQCAGEALVDPKWKAEADRILGERKK